jgi:hypothetical protein
MPAGSGSSALLMILATERLSQCRFAAKFLVTGGPNGADIIKSAGEPVLGAHFHLRTRKNEATAFSLDQWHALHQASATAKD